MSLIGAGVRMYKRWECSFMPVNRLMVLLIATTVVMLTLGQAANANLLIKVDKSTQRMTVTVNGNQLYDRASPPRYQQLYHDAPALFPFFLFGRRSRRRSLLKTRRSLGNRDRHFRAAELAS